MGLKLEQTTDDKEVLYYLIILVDGKKAAYAAIFEEKLCGYLGAEIGKALYGRVTISMDSRYRQGEKLAISADRIQKATRASQRTITYDFTKDLAVDKPYLLSRMLGG